MSSIIWLTRVVVRWCVCAACCCCSACVDSWRTCRWLHNNTDCNNLSQITRSLLSTTSRLSLFYQLTGELGIIIISGLLRSEYGQRFYGTNLNLYFKLSGVYAYKNSPRHSTQPAQVVCHVHFCFHGKPCEAHQRLQTGATDTRCTRPVVGYIQ